MAAWLLTKGERVIQGQCLGSGYSEHRRRVCSFTPSTDGIEQASTCACNTSTWTVEAGGSGVRGQSWLHSTFKASLGYMKPSQMNKSRIHPGRGMVSSRKGSKLCVCFLRSHYKGKCASRHRGEQWIRMGQRHRASDVMEHSSRISWVKLGSWLGAKRSRL